MGVKNRRRWLKKLSFRLLRVGYSSTRARSLHDTQERLEAEDIHVTSEAAVSQTPCGAVDRRLSRPFAVRHPELQGAPLVVLFLSRLDPKKVWICCCQPRDAGQGPIVALVVAGTGAAAFVQKLQADAAAAGETVGRPMVGFGRATRSRQPGRRRPLRAPVLL